MKYGQPKTRGGRIGYACLWGVTCLILAAMVTAPIVMFVHTYGSDWWELIFILYIAMIPLYLQLLALLKAAHYLVRRRMGAAEPSCFGDVCHALYAFLGAQCLWLVYTLLGDEGLFNWHGAEVLYYLSGVAILILGAVDLICAAVQRCRKKQQKRATALEADRLEWEQKLT